MENYETEEQIKRQKLRWEELQEENRRNTVNKVPEKEHKVEQLNVDTLNFPPEEDLSSESEDSDSDTLSLTISTDES